MDEFAKNLKLNQAKLENKANKNGGSATKKTPRGISPRKASPRKASPSGFSPRKGTTPRG